MRERRPATLDAPVQEFDSLTDFRQDQHALPSGRFSVGLNDRPVDFQLVPRDSDALIITYHGAILADVSLPWFTGKGVTSQTGASWLSVSDPALHYDPALTLGWYAGTVNKPTLQCHIAAVIEEVATRLGASHLIFMGVSGGGFSALEASIRFPGSVAVVGNPQTAIKNYVPTQVQRYVDAAWSGKSPFEVNSTTRVVHDLNRAFTAASNTVAYLQNSRDAFHISMHLLPFFKKNADTGRAWLLMDAWGSPVGDGHIPPPKTLMADILTQLAAAQGDWSRVLDEAGFDNAVDPSTLRQRAADSVQRVDEQD